MTGFVKKLVQLIVLVLVGIVLVLIGRWTAPDAAPEGGESSADEVAVETWTCPMHPQIKLPEFGACPICGMDLVPLSTGDDAGPRRMVMTPDAVRLAGVRTELVTRRFVTLPVRMVGKVDYDETAVQTISAWVAGRLERLFVDYTGVVVKEGEHLFELYSPDLLTAQEELLSAKARAESAPVDTSDFLRESSRRAHQTARQKLILWGLSEEQVDAVELRGTGEDRITIHSPSTGTVIAKYLDRGAYVETGTKVYTIADLSRLWVQLDAYEQDLPWLRYGQEVSITAEALPGESFSGWISFIDPVVDERVRTAKVRVTITNADRRLKPGMFVRAVAHTRLAAGGDVLSPWLAGKWVSPMHPEIVKDGPGQCDVCGMDLVAAEDLGYVTDESARLKPLVVPTSAVLVTGTRAVAYVDVPGTDKPTYEGRVVILGPRAGDDYIVRSGLEEGERVVIHGAFRIDSSMQIQAKPSLLSLPAEGGGARGREGELFRASLAPVYSGYLEMQLALADDDNDRARRVLDGLEEAVALVRPESLPRGAARTWREERPLLVDSVRRAVRAEGIAALRTAFESLSESVLALAHAFGLPGDESYHEAFCPMAADGKGGRWLQVGEVLANPYFGSEMLRCGELRGTFDDPSRQVAEASGGDVHAGHAHEPGVPAAPYTPAFDAYLEAQAGLAGDDFRRAQSAFAGLTEALAGLEEESESAPPTLVAWLEAARRANSDEVDIESLRVAFDGVSQAAIALLDELGNQSGRELHELFCPMAFDDAGAAWLQAEEVIANPYFGASMLGCGAVQRSFPAE